LAQLTQWLNGQGDPNPSTLSALPVLGSQTDTV
jgi:hypothetical protein